MTNKMVVTTKPEVQSNRESDGRFALKMESKTSLSRWAKRDAQREARRLELEAMYGDDACMYA